MAKKLSTDNISKLLGDASPEKSFFVNCGPTIKNISELQAALNSMSNEQYLYHRNNTKNDFYNWVLQVIGDSRLANDLARAKTKETAAKKVKERLDYLQSMIKRA